MLKIIQKYKLIGIAFLLLSTCVANASISLGFGTPVQTGAVIDIDVTISGLGIDAAPSIASYDLDIIFDSSHLSFSSATLGDSGLGNQLDLFGLGINDSAITLSGAGVLNIYEISLDDAVDLNNFQPDSFALATLTFDVLKADSTQLSFFVNDLGDADNNFLSATLTTGTVSTVPLPTAFWFMASGLGLLYRKRNK